MYYVYTYISLLPSNYYSINSEFCLFLCELQNILQNIVGVYLIKVQ